MTLGGWSAGGGGVDGGIVPVEVPIVVGHQLGSLGAKGLQKSFQCLNNELPIDFSPLVSNSGVNQSLGMKKKAKTILFFLEAWFLAFVGAGEPFGNH